VTAETLLTLLPALGLGGVLGALVKAWADRRSSRDATTVAAANSAIEAFRALTTAQAAELAGAREEMRKQAAEHEARLTDALKRLNAATARADNLSREHAALLDAYVAEREFVELLIAKWPSPPPPPPRPRPRHRLDDPPPPDQKEAAHG